VRAEVADTALWDALPARPLGGLLRDGLGTDIARGIALTDGLIGTFSWADDPPAPEPLLPLPRDRRRHRRLGRPRRRHGPSERRARTRRRAGAEIRVNATVTAIAPAAP
jgi:hypothetical protein